MDVFDKILRTRINFSVVEDPEARAFLQKLDSLRTVDDVLVTLRQTNDIPQFVDIIDILDMSIIETNVRNSMATNELKTQIFGAERSDYNRFRRDDASESSMRGGGHKHHKIPLMIPSARVHSKRRDRDDESVRKHKKHRHRRDDASSVSSRHRRRRDDASSVSSRHRRRRDDSSTSSRRKRRYDDASSTSSRRRRDDTSSTRSGSRFSGSDSGSDDSDSGSGTDYESEVDPMEEMKRRNQAINYLTRARSKGVEIDDMLFSDECPTDKIVQEADRIFDLRSKTFAVNNLEMMLVNATKAIEFFGTRFGFMTGGGWSKEVQREVDDYDDVFFQLVEKHKKSLGAMMEPEALLLQMWVGSGMKYVMQPKVERLVKEVDKRKEEAMDQQVIEEMEREQRLYEQHMQEGKA